MKVRWTQGSLRLRITPSELAAMGRGEGVGEQLKVPGGACWRVRLQPGEATQITSHDGDVVLLLSPSDRERLAVPETEGVYFQTADGLRYLVEKDFPCAHPRAAEALEPPAETFIAPDDFERRKREGELG